MFRMSEIALAKINSFAHVAQQADVPPEDPILEIPLSEFQGLLNELATTYNQMAEMVRDPAIRRGRELARMTQKPQTASKPQDRP